MSFTLAARASAFTASKAALTTRSSKTSARRARGGVVRVDSSDESGVGSSDCDCGAAGGGAPCAASAPGVVEPRRPPSEARRMLEATLEVDCLMESDARRSVETHE